MMPQNGDRIITVRQPWAYAIFNLNKNVENRTWKTNYRGKLWIHSAQKIVIDERIINIYTRNGFKIPSVHEMSTGRIIGSVELSDVLEPSEYINNGFRIRANLE